MVQVCLALVPLYPECLMGCDVWPCRAVSTSSQGAAPNFAAAEDRQLRGVKFVWVRTAAQHEPRRRALCLSLFWKLCSCHDTILPLICKNENRSHNTEKKQRHAWKVTASKHCWKWKRGHCLLRLPPASKETDIWCWKQRMWNDVFGLEG